MFERIISLTPKAVPRTQYNAVCDNLRSIGPIWPIVEGGREDLRFFGPESFKPDVLWPFSETVMINSNPAKDEHIGWQISEIRTISPKEGRNKQVIRFFPKMVREHHYWIDQDGTYSGAANYYGWGGKKWVDCCFNSKLDPHEQNHSDKAHCDRINMAQSGALTKRYEWSVQFSLDGSHPIEFVTDAFGAREIFADRDKPETGDRRRALRHWVRAHYRKKRTSEEDAARIRAHLRGATLFDWRGFRCTLCPSQFDLEQISAKRA